MSDAENIETSSDDQLDTVDTFNIADLRKVAKLMGVQAARDWDKAAYVAAIKHKQMTNSTTSFVFDTGKAPKPGWARIIIHRDPTPGHKNSSIQLGFNGAIIGVPRGIEIDVPSPFVEILNNASTVYVEQASDATRDNPGGVYKDERRPSYPYQVIAITPGEYHNPNDNRQAAYKRREEFYTRFGTWPTEAELKEYKKVQMNKDLR